MAEKKARAQQVLDDSKRRLAEAERELAWMKDGHALVMGLWNGAGIEDTPLRWQCKRLVRDLALRQHGGEKNAVAGVTRADRLGRAAADIAGDGLVRVIGLFEQDEWNGRLQAPRAQLEAIARIRDNPTPPDEPTVTEAQLEAIARIRDNPKLTVGERRNRVAAMMSHVRWLITFSAKLQPQGPWIGYASSFSDEAPSKPFVSRKGEYAVRHESNDTRQGLSKLILSRLPGLRLLSVDLGHRYAAACAVWETLSGRDMRDACKAAGRPAPKECDIYLHVKGMTKKQPSGKEGEKTAIYRRVGPDKLPNGREHPAPWARLDRQFLVKLQGEDRSARKASPGEIAAVQGVEKAAGREPMDRRSLQVDDLMSDAVRTARLALQRHGRRARVAFNLTATSKLLPGGRQEVLKPEGRTALLADMLADWYALFTGKGWTDEWVEKQWATHIAPLLGGATLPEVLEDGDASPQAHKKFRTDLAKTLQPVAEGLAKNDPLCQRLHCLWATRWREDDAAWQKHLRWLRDWILPRGKRARDRVAIRHVGGLSLTRIATIKSLYQVQKAFHMRPEPDDLRKNIPARGEDALRDFGLSVLNTMERMREQRVKQLASRIVEAALGVGRMKHPGKGKDPKRPRARVDQPCHAVVIENLTHYRPEETRTRRENRQLMSWCSSKVKKYLSEACQLHGLHLREVQASYTSRQDSRTGAPGARCTDVPVKEFMQSPFWRKQVAQAERKLFEGKGDARERYLCSLNAKWKDKSETAWNKAGAVRIPARGGEIFVSADPASPTAKGLQADLNAAANIGLRALLDPDWPARWWYVPCDSKDCKPDRDRVKGCAVLDANTTLRIVTAGSDAEADTAKGEKRAKASGRDIINLWRNVSSRPLTANNGPWVVYAAYWNQVQAQVIKNLR
jgi:IS605 OrfB family transposase